MIDEEKSKKKKLLKVKKYYGRWVIMGIGSKYIYYEGNRISCCIYLGKNREELEGMEIKSFFEEFNKRKELRKLEDKEYQEFKKRVRGCLNENKNRLG